MGSVCVFGPTVGRTLPLNLKDNNVGLPERALFKIIAVFSAGIYSSIRARISSTRDVFLSLGFLVPKAFSTRSCFCLWIFTMFSSTEPFTMNYTHNKYLYVHTHTTTASVSMIKLHTLVTTFHTTRSHVTSDLSNDNISLLAEAVTPVHTLVLCCWVPCLWTHKCQCVHVCLCVRKV